jgi:hypothetical protein
VGRGGGGGTLMDPKAACLPMNPCRGEELWVNSRTTSLPAGCLNGGEILPPYGRLFEG